MSRPFLRAAAAALVVVPLLAAGAAAAPQAPRVVTVLPPLGTSAPVPSSTGTAAVLSALTSVPAFGGGLSGEVVDAVTGDVLWQQTPATPLLVASTQKLLVAAAALTVLGPGSAPTTSFAATGAVTGGTLDGDLFLRGGGDVLFAAQPAVWPAVATVDQLAAALKAAGVTRVTGRLVADASRFGGPATAPGWRPTYVSEGSVAPVSALEVDRGTVPGRLARTTDPAGAAAAAVRAALARQGISVGPIATGVTPAGARTLAAVAGPPVDVEVQEMLQDSDNDLAESLGRQVAIATGQPATFAGAATAIAATLQKLGLPTAGLHLDDASGLSRLDAVPPVLLAAVLRQAATTRTEWRALLAGLPVAAFSGTLTKRDGGVSGAAAAGVVRAKTGNLSGVTAVAGTVVDRDGRLLLFSFVTNSAVGLEASEAALDALAGALVAL